MNLQDPAALVVPKLKTAIAELADDDMRQIVAGIEGKVKTTQNNYGGYMSALSAFGTTEPVMLFVIGNAMLACGGNKAGIESAIKIIAGV